MSIPSISAPIGSKRIFFSFSHQVLHLKISIYLELHQNICLLNHHIFFFINLFQKYYNIIFSKHYSLLIYLNQHDCPLLKNTSKLFFFFYLQTVANDGEVTE